MSDNSAGGGVGGDLATPLSIIGVVFGGGALYAATWLGGTLGVAVTGAGWHPPQFGLHGVFSLIGGGPGRVWPGHGTAATVGMVVLLVLVLAGLAAAAWFARGFFGHRSGLAGLRDVRSLAPKAVTARARVLRPALADAEVIVPNDAGVLLGNLDAYNGPELRASWEDVLLAIMAPRSGKSTSLAIPAVMSAPGCCVATSNKYDVYAATRAFRQRQGGVIWTFDAQGVIHQERGMWWDMLAMARTIEGARRLAGHFALGGGSDKSFDDFWMKAARNLLTALFHSAATSGGTVHDVLGWLATPADRASTDALKASGKEALAAQLQATIAGSIETRDGIYQTARECLACLVDPEIAAWVLPDDRRPQFRPLDFVRSHDTLYLLSQSGGGGAAPIIAAAADAVMRAGVVIAERSGGRMPVPVVVVLDEAANICKIADLPELYSHLGSRGIIPITILQSYRQGTGVWGETGMDALWSAATVKLLGAGLDDPKFAEEVSGLVGPHMVPERSVSHSSSGSSTSLSRRRERVMEASEIRAMDKGTALLLATGVKVAQIRLRPWYAEPDAPQISADIQAEQSEITMRAAAEVLE
ncbi:TraM-binding TraD/TraG-like protein [Streptomyces sp. 846.5]|nr:type IV secretory system conjugative DNA transfer family protein [Streptomyces sp. 846.5]TDT93351.1 TraM-binding TraD/TraG-like protein [Streptomyces sp. 846.5]